jgi:hypothetical protein
LESLLPLNRIDDGSLLMLISYGALDYHLSDEQLRCVSLPMA